MTDPPAVDLGDVLSWGRPAIPDAAYKAAGRAMLPFADDDLFEWHECVDQPNCAAKQGDPCACAGIPWPSPAVRAAIAAAWPHLANTQRRLDATEARHNAYCWTQDHRFTACDRAAGHLGRHSWELGAGDV